MESVTKAMDRYEIRGAIQKGGFGTVFKAWDRQLQRFAALKRLDQANVDAVTRVDDMWWEAISLASLQHPNILSVYDFNTDEQGPYLIMEYVEGMNLGEFVQSYPYSLDDFREAAVQILRGLIAAHDKNLVHQDIKPSNIMVTRQPGDYLLYKILDFGMVDILEGKAANPFADRKHIYGSLYYITPEQLRKQPPDFRTDLYALGCVFYYMLAKQHAFSGKTAEDIMRRHLAHDVQPLMDLRPDAPLALAEWVMRFISLEPAERPVSALEAFHSLQEIG